MHDPMNLKIAYIGGGSQGWAWQLMGDLALEKRLCGTVHLYDINHQAAAQNAVIGNRIANQPDCLSPWRYIHDESPHDALTDADFVIISILPGTLEEMASDIHTPEKYGVLQPVGDTTGPGGIVRALRTGPMFQQFAEWIRQYCPLAYVINYTNPMGLCMRVLYETFPAIRAVGCCHEVFTTQKLLCTALEEIKGIVGVTRQQLYTNVQGVNHFTFLSEAYYGAMDLKPVYEAFIARHPEGYEQPGVAWASGHATSANLVKFDLFRRTGDIAAAGDRHLAEFNPQPRYLRDTETVASWKFTLTSIAFRLNKQQARLKKGERLYQGLESYPIAPSGEEGVAMICALCGLGNMITNVNLPNRGQLQGLPLHVVTESNALLSGAGITPLFAGQMKDAVIALSLHAAKAQSILWEAVEKRDAAIAFQAFLNDPLCCCLSTSDALALYREMLDATKIYLEGWSLA